MAADLFFPKISNRKTESFVRYKVQWTGTHPRSECDVSNTFLASMCTSAL